MIALREEFRCRLANNVALIFVSYFSFSFIHDTWTPDLHYNGHLHVLYDIDNHPALLIIDAFKEWTTDSICEMLEIIMSLYLKF